MMDYKYINQLLKRYWRCETSLEEEDILRAFFSQADIPADLKRYQPLFAYQREEPKVDVLGDDFDKKILAMTEEPKVVKARIVSMPQRLRPLFKAAAIVAIVLTLGNAIQVPFSQKSQDPISSYDGYSKPEIEKGTSVAMSDSASIDSVPRAMTSTQSSTGQVMIK